MGIALIAAGLIMVASHTGSLVAGEKPYIKMDNKAVMLLNAHKELNQRQRGMNGFRIQVYTDSGTRSQFRTERVRSEFDSRNLGIRSYISYDEPYFKLRVGDFRTRLDAHKFLNKISVHYPAAIIVVDRINFPPLTEQQQPVPTPVEGI